MSLNNTRIALGIMEGRKTMAPFKGEAMKVELPLKPVFVKDATTSHNGSELAFDQIGNYLKRLIDDTKKEKMESDAK